MAQLKVEQGIIHWNFSRGDDTEITITKQGGWEAFEDIRFDVKNRREITDKAIIELRVDQGISIDGDAMTISLTSEQTRQFSNSRYVADIRLRSQGKVIPPVPFFLNVAPTVTAI